MGDPECRVVVWLGGEHPSRWEATHDYAAVESTEPGGPALG